MVAVNIQDVNDEAPRFLSSAYSLGLEENRPPGYEVGILSATDADEYPFNSFSFSLLPSGSFSDAFVIDARSGRITTTRSLDREEQEYFYMTALVSDVNAQTLCNTAGVTVYVMDINDNQPSFVVSGVKNVTNVATRISNQARIGTVIMQVSLSASLRGTGASIGDCSQGSLLMHSTLAYKVFSLTVLESEAFSE